MPNKRIIGIVVTTTFLLLIPLIAMQFTNEVNWTFSDFIVAGALLLITGLMCDLVIRRVSKMEYRIVLCLAILAALVILWLELAVGIFGTPFGGS